MFASLHRSVTIGVLCGAALDAQLRKSAASLLWSIWCAGNAESGDSECEWPADSLSVVDPIALLPALLPVVVANTDSYCRIRQVVAVDILHFCGSSAA